MIRFDGKARKGRRPPRNYLSRREQYRLLAMVFAVGFVVMIVAQAIQPGNWTWLVREANKQTEPSQASPTATTAAPEPATGIDTRYHPKPIPAMPLDTVRLAKAEQAATSEEEGYFPGVAPSQLREVRDNQPFRSVEAAAWYNLLGVLDKASAADLEAQSEKVGFVQLFQQPEAYRGKLVTFQGRVRRLTARDAANNSAGIAKYFELVLKPETGPPRPVIAYVLNLPEALKTKASGELDEPIQLTGFFFKNWVYAGERATYVAPVLLAREVRWSPPVVEPVKMPDIRAIAAVVGGSTLAAALIAWMAYRVSRRDVQMSETDASFQAQSAVALMAEFDAPKKVGTAGTMPDSTKAP